MRTRAGHPKGSSSREHLDPSLVLRSLWQRLTSFLRRLFAAGGSGYLCDRCKWDYGDACNRPERPNAVTCPDYKRR